MSSCGPAGYMALAGKPILVCLHMSPQVGPVCKPLAALVAAKRFLSRVKAGVVLEEPGAGEGLLAHVALEVPDVCLQVHGQGGHAHVELVTDVARLGSVCRESLVGLSVSGQVGGGGEHLATVGAALLLLLGSVAEHVDHELRVLGVGVRR